MSRSNSVFIRINHINHDNHGSFALLVTLGAAGGHQKKKCKKIMKTAGQNHVEQPEIPSVRESMGEFGHVKHVFNVEKLNNIVWQIDDSKLLIPLHVDRSKYDTHEELFNAIREWWIDTKGKEERTILNRIRYARAMKNHKIFPVDWFKFEPEQIINQLQYKKKIEYPEKARQLGKNPKKYGHWQIINDWKTVRMFAKAYGVDISYWGYEPQKPPEPQRKVVPRPYDVNRLMNEKYSKDRYTNVLIKTMLTVGFHIGWRPEDAVKQKIADIYFDNCTMIISECKKADRELQIWLDNRVMNSQRQNSLRNLVYIWRPRHVTPESGDILFIRKNGKPFNVNTYRKFLNEYVKPLWGRFHLYAMRDWCCIARLIRTYVQNKKWDIRTVKNFIGHDSEKTTEKHYLRFAEFYYENDPYDWLNAVLKFHADSKKHLGTAERVEPNHSNQKINKQPKNAVCGQNSRSNMDAPVGI